MKRLVMSTAITALVLALTVPVFGQAPQQDPSQQRPAVAEKTYEGQLSSVDAAEKKITLKGSDNKEMVFTYNESTRMVGIDDSPQGLTGKTGSNLKVTYHEDRGSNLATRIEAAPSK